MTILTSFTSATYKAQIRSSLEKGFKQMYSGTCTESAQRAAKNLVGKWFGEAAAGTVRMVKDPAEITALVGDFFDDPSRKQVFDIWSFDSKAKSPSSSQLSTINSQPVEVITPLSEIDADLARLHAAITGQIHEFQDAVLPNQLKMGLHCLKAHVLFCMTPKKSGALKGKKRSSTVDDLSPQGFEGWLQTRHPHLKKGTAYRWMTAFKGLGLSESHKEKDVDAALKKLTQPTLASLCAASLDAIGPPPPEQTLQQSEFEFLRDGLRDFREQAEQILHLKTQLQAHPEMLRASTARIYDLLYQLTGTHWKPTDEPDDLASVDPDAITL